MLARRGIMLLSLGAMLLMVAIPPATSDGGFFWPGEFGVYQNAERVIFTVNGDGTITVVLGISFEGEAEEFSWVYPVPSVPKLGVAETESLEILDAATTPEIRFKTYYCEHLRATGGGGGGGGPDMLAAGGIGPYDYVVLGGGDDPEALVTWLRENEYQMPEGIEPVIAAYVEEGMYFLAMRLSQDFSTQDIQPIVITYEADRIVFPMRLTATAAVEDMPIKIWIFADKQYVLKNYAHPTPDFSRFRAASRVANVGYWRHNPHPETAYGIFDELRRYQDLNDGQVFLTRFAGPSTTLLADERWFLNMPNGAMVREDEFLMDLIGRFPYLTYLWTHMSPEQMTLDPIFIPSSSAEDVSLIHDLSDEVSPLEYWGCSTAWAMSVQQRANVPGAHTHFADLRFTVAHPADWVLSTIETDSTVALSPIYVYAPEIVNRATLDAFFAGGTAPPMFVFAEGSYHSHELSHDWWFLQEAYRQFFNLPYSEEDRLATEGEIPIQVRYFPREPGSIPNWSTDIPAIFLSVLASEEDWETDGAMFDSMLAYAQTFQYYLHPELKHTLFLDGYGLSAYTLSVQVPYPAGWEVVFSKQRLSEILIKPSTFIGEEYAPRARLIPLRQVVAPIVYNEGTTVLSHALDWLWEAYDLPVDDRESTWRHAIECEDQALPFGSEDTGVSGWVKVTSGYVIEFSAPAQYIRQYGDKLQLMAESTPSGLSCE